MKTLFLDMDGVIVDFEAEARSRGITPQELKLIPGAYRNLPFMPGAQDIIHHVIGYVENDIGGRVMIATKIPHDNPSSATEKLEWVNEHLPMLRKRVIITPDKGCLGDEQDILMDDRPHKARVESFRGHVIVYGTNHVAKRLDRIYHVDTWTMAFKRIMFIFGDPPGLREFHKDPAADSLPADLR